jgi:hypothetical protein
MWTEKRGSDSRRGNCIMRKTTCAFHQILLRWCVNITITGNITNVGDQKCMQIFCQKS